MVVRYTAGHGHGGAQLKLKLSINTQKKSLGSGSSVVVLIVRLRLHLGRHGEAAERAEAAGGEPAEDAVPVEAVRARQRPDRVARRVALQAHRALLPQGSHGVARRRDADEPAVRSDAAGLRELAPQPHAPPREDVWA